MLFTWYDKGSLIKVMPCLGEPCNLWLSVFKGGEICELPIHVVSEMVFLCYTGNCLFFVRRSSPFRGHWGASRKYPLCPMSLAQLEIWPWHWTFEATQETWSEFCCLPCDCQRRRKTDDWLWPIWPEVFFCGFIILSAKDVCLKNFYKY